MKEEGRNCGDLKVTVGQTYLTKKTGLRSRMLFVNSSEGNFDGFDRAFNMINVVSADEHAHTRKTVFHLCTHARAVITVR